MEPLQPIRWYTYIDNLRHVVIGESMINTAPAPPLACVPSSVPSLPVLSVSAGGAPMGHVTI